mgnify:CR=1 FL=1
MADFDDDLRAWQRYLARIHTRHTSRQDGYIALQSVAERVGHTCVARHNAGNETFLEIGVGGGEHIPFERDCDARFYVACDVSPDHARWCRDSFGIPTTCSDGAALPFEDDTFDSVLALGVLEHVVDLDGLLREVQRVLRPGGAFLVVVPTNGSLTIATFRALVSYPSMWRQGIRRPWGVWHYENVNHFVRIRTLLAWRFTLHQGRGLPLGLWWRLAPLYFFHVINDREEGAPR